MSCRRRSPRSSTGSRLRGLVCDVGGPTHHTVILVRSLGVPAVVGLGGASQAITPGQILAIDGDTGEVMVEPTPEVLEGWSRRARPRRGHAARAGRTARAVRPRPPTASASSSKRTWKSPRRSAAFATPGAEGIGLYRSEFLLDGGAAGEVPEEVQLDVYRGLLEAMAPLPVTIRTFDVGRGPRRGRRAERTSRPLRPARHPRRPAERRPVPRRRFARSCAPRRPGRCGSCCRSSRSAEEMRQARAIIAERRARCAAGRRGAGRRDDRSAGRRAHGRSSGRARRTS